MSDALTLDSPTSHRPYVRSRNERLNTILSEMASEIRSAARFGEPGIAISLKLSGSLGEGDSREHTYVGSCPGLATVAHDLVYADIDGLGDGISTSLRICHLLRLEIGPFIIGVGWVVLEEVPGA